MKTYTRIAMAAAILAPIVLGTASAQWSLTGNAAGANDFLGSTNAQDLRIKAGNADRMRITTAGKVGIGTTAPSGSDKVTILQTVPSAPQIRLSDAGGSWDFWAGGNFHIREVTTAVSWLTLEANASRVKIGPASEIFVNTTTGNVGIGTTTPVSRLTVNGTITPRLSCTYNIGSSTRKWNIIYACNGTIQTSDAHLKQNIHDLSYGLNDLMKLRPVSFTWANDPAYGTKLGLIAQEVQQVVGEVVKTGEDGSMGIFYSDLIPVLIKSIQQQQEISVDRSKEHGTLRTASDDLDARLAHLEELVNAGSQSGVETPEIASGAVRLEQNDPNPTGEMTTISYFLPNTAGNAEVVISEIGSGTVVERIAVTERGAGEISVRVKEYRNGTYIYSMIIDGKTMASRKMVVTK